MQSQNKSTTLTTASTETTVGFAAPEFHSEDPALQSSQQHHARTQEELVRVRVPLALARRVQKHYPDLRLAEAVSTHLRLTAEFQPVVPCN